MATHDASTATVAARSYHAAHPLGTLPVELLYRIVRQLSTTEFCALRLSCRAVERGLFQTFSHEFFSRKQFMMSGPSLQALIDISRHPYLSRKLEHVTIGLEYLGHFVPLPYHNSQEYRPSLEALADQNTLFSSGRAVEMLAEAFANLPNLKTVSIRDEPSRTRFRDFNSGLKHWNSYGYPTLLKTTNLEIESSSSDEKATSSDEKATFSAHVFNAISTALAKSAARPESIEILLRDRQQGVPDTAFWIPPSPAEQERHKGMLAGLRKLHLSIVLDSKIGVIPERENYMRRLLDPQRRLDGSYVDGDGVPYSFACCDYIHAAQNLEWLRINFQDRITPGTSQHNSMCGAFLLYLASTCGDSSRRVDGGIAYPKLKRLDLGFTRTSVLCMCKMLECFPTIEVLSLHRSTLIPNGNIGSLKGALWKDLMKHLPAAAPNLKRLEVSGPVESAALCRHEIVLEKDHYNFAIQVEDGENIADECAKAASKLSYVATAYAHNWPLNAYDLSDMELEEGDEDMEHDSEEHEDDSSDGEDEDSEEHEDDSSDGEDDDSEE